ncbi:MAG: diguanylate cyclase, partial [Pigmentiphaga sp.]
MDNLVFANDAPPGKLNFQGCTPGYPASRLIPEESGPPIPFNRKKWSSLDQNRWPSLQRNAWSSWLRNGWPSLQRNWWSDAAGIRNDHLNQEWKRAQREGRPLSLVMVDIDHFKAYNDYYGHLAGDDCLQRVARTLETVVARPGDLAAR